jgi:four helix bundle protein
MNKYRNTPLDIHNRIYKFIINCFNNVVKIIPKNTENISTIQQISSSLTSMGANDQEADAAGSKKDFIAKFVIVRKETKETRYWLRFIKDTKLINSDIVDPYINECEEILLIVGKIIENTIN